jgi:hypothetical protein
VPDTFELNEARNYAWSVHKAYEAEANALRSENTFAFGLPLIGLAAGSVGALLFKAHPDTTSGLALGGGTLGGVSLYADNIERAKIYRRGAEKINCLVRASRFYDGQSGQIDRLKIQIEDITKKGGLEEIAVAKLVNNAGEDDPAWVDAKDALRSALTAARAALRTGTEAKSIYEKIGDRLFEAVKKIEGLVAQLFDQRQVSIDDVRSSIMSALTKAAENKTAIDEIRENLRKAEAARTSADAKVAAKIAAGFTMQAFTAQSNDTPKLLTETAKQLDTATKEISGLSEGFINASNKMDECASSI